MHAFPNKHLIYKSPKQAPLLEIIHKMHAFPKKILNG